MAKRLRDVCTCRKPNTVADRGCGFIVRDLPDSPNWDCEGSCALRAPFPTPARGEYEERENYFVDRFPGVGAARQRRANFHSAFSAL
jgi:hypothetical protein